MSEKRPVPRVAILACDVLQDEVEHLAGGMAHVCHLEFLPMGLHDHPPSLRAELQGCLDRAEARAEVEAVVLVFGLCGNGTAGLGPRRVPLVLPRAHDCVTLFMGCKDRYAAYQKMHPGTYYYTPGWNRGRRVPGPDRLEQLRAEYAERFEDEEAVEYLLEVERETWAKTDRATYIDHGLAGGEAECAYARRCAESLGFAFEAVRGDPSLLRDLLGGAWDSRRFLVVPPGHCIAPTHDDRIVKTQRQEP